MKWNKDWETATEGTGESRLLDCADEIEAILRRHLTGETK